MISWQGEKRYSKRKLNLFKMNQLNFWIPEGIVLHWINPHKSYLQILVWAGMKLQRMMKKMEIF